ncbi:TPA: hypothetical protein ACVOZB_004597 [Vibrio diabolicus]
MAAYISEGYPHRLTNREIEQHIREYSEEIVKFRGRNEFTSAYVPLIQLGQAELQNRQNKKVVRLTLFISILSLVVSLAALFVSYSSMDSSNNWEQSQIQLLQELKGTMADLKFDGNISVEVPTGEVSKAESTANKAFKADSQR